MKLPTNIPGLRGATLIVGVLLLAWIAPEGRLWLETGMGVLVTAVLLAHLLQHFLGGRVLSVTAWVGVTAVFGFLFGLGSALLTLFLMAAKTGLHAHGPEFTPAEINWVWAQLPLWSLTGALGGFGLGMLTASIRQKA
jgi:hypothetical protein